MTCHIRKRHQNEQLRIPSHTPHVEPSPHYTQDCRSPPESRPTTTAYHKPTREKPQGFTFSKIPAKHRGSLRKMRTQYGLPRNNVTMQPPRAYVQPQVLPRTVINPNVYTNQQTTPPANTNRNGGNLISNNQPPLNQTPSNNHNVQRNGTQFGQTPQQCGKSAKKHQLKHATREQDQARAMVQVVRWLEREFSQNASSGRKHVHEHIHHHYHHYHTEALVWFLFVQM